MWTHNINMPKKQNPYIMMIKSNEKDMEESYKQITDPLEKKKAKAMLDYVKKRNKDTIQLIKDRNK